MSASGYAWALRRRLLGDELVVLSDHIAALSRSRALGRRARLRARALFLRELAFGPPSHARIRVDGTNVHLGTRDFAIDWRTFVDIFGRDEYPAPYAGAHVLDIGGHKGYFGAYALALGAAVVVSFEPALNNYAALERAARPLGDRWLTRNAAVGSASGIGVLRLDRTSWAHSLVEVERPEGEQAVSIVTLEEALSQLRAGGSTTIVKIDAEGSECEILSDPEPLARVTVLMVEYHPRIARCPEGELIASVKAGGLELTSRQGGVLRFSRI